MTDVKADAKIIERIGKLLRLAAPSSGSTEAERSSAALEAARLIDEHGVAIAEPKDKSKKRVAQGVWVHTQALQHCSCSACHGLIAPGDVVWFRVVNHQREYRHNTKPCGVT